MTKRAHLETAAIVALFAAYVAFRFWRLTASCLWFDEIFSVHAASQPWSSILGFVAQDLIHPPLFYILLKIWTTVGGESVLWARMFPFAFAAAALIPLYFLARDLRLRTSQTLLAIAFIASSGTLIKYAQEVRMYSVVLCVSLFSIWLFVRFFYLGKNIWILTAVNAVLVYTHYFGWLLVLSEVIAIIALQRIKIRQMLIMLGILIVAAAPWLIYVYEVSVSTTGLAQNIGWIGAPGIKDTVNFAFDLIEPFYFEQNSNDAMSMFVFTVPIALILFASFIIFLADFATAEERDRSNFKMLAVLAGVPIVVAYAASWVLPYSIWGTRHLLFVLTPLAIVGAIAINGISSKIVRVSAISLISAAIVFAFLAHAATPPKSFIWCAWEQFAAKVPDTEPVTIYTFEDLVAYDTWFAVRNRPNIAVKKVNGIEGLEEDRAFFIPRGFSAIESVDKSGITGDHFFLAFRDSMWNEKHPPLHELIQRGYEVGEPVVFEAQGNLAFLVEVRKKQ